METELNEKQKLVMLYFSELENFCKQPEDPMAANIFIWAADKMVKRLTELGETCIPTVSKMHYRAAKYLLHENGLA